MEGPARRRRPMRRPVRPLPPTTPSHHDSPLTVSVRTYEAVKPVTTAAHTWLCDDGGEPRVLIVHATGTDAALVAACVAAACCPSWTDAERVTCASQAAAAYHVPPLPPAGLDMVHAVAAVHAAGHAATGGAYRLMAIAAVPTEATVTARVPHALFVVVAQHGEIVYDSRVRGGPSMCATVAPEGPVTWRVRGRVVRLRPGAFTVRVYHRRAATYPLPMPPLCVAAADHHTGPPPSLPTRSVSTCRSRPWGEWGVHAEPLLALPAAATTLRTDPV